MTIFKKLFEVKKEGIKLQRDTKAFNYKYATLNQIQEKLSEVFEKQQLLIIHSIEDNSVVTRIIDIESEAEIKSSIEMTPDTKPQDKGSEITYYRRYNLLSLLDLEVEDDDGAKAQNSNEAKKQANDNLPWITEAIIEKVVAKNEQEGLNLTIKDIREKYKVSKANAELLKNLGIN